MSKDTEFPEFVEGHRGPAGGMMFCEPNYPGHVFHRYIREDIVKDMVADGHISFDAHMELKDD